MKNIRMYIEAYTLIWTRYYTANDILGGLKHVPSRINVPYELVSYDFIPPEK